MPAGVHHADLLPVVRGANSALERHVDQFGDGQRVHVGPQCDDRAGSPAAKNADDTVAANSGLHLDPECPEVLRDQRGGSRLLERQLGMLVDVATPLYDT